MFLAWETIKAFWKAAGICFLLVMLAVLQNDEKVEAFNNFGKWFGAAGEIVYAVVINATFYGGLLFCMVDAMAVMF